MRDDDNKYGNFERYYVSLPTAEMEKQRVLPNLSDEGLKAEKRPSPFTLEDFGGIKPKPT